MASEPVPILLGWQPFFPRHDGAYVAFRTTDDWATQAGASTNHGFHASDPGGTAEIVWPGKRLALRMRTSPELGDFVAMMPPAPADFFALEPAATANSAAKEPASRPRGLRRLVPGESFGVNMTLKVEELA